MKGPIEADQNTEGLVGIVSLPIIAALGLVSVQFFRWLKDGVWPDWSLQWAIGSPPTVDWKGVQSDLNGLYSVPLWCFCLIAAFIMGVVGSRLIDVMELYRHRRVDRRKRAGLTEMGKLEGTQTGSQKDRERFSPNQGM